MSGKLFVVSAPSGAGKTSLVAAVLERMKSQHPIDRVVTYTSRQDRLGEQQGKAYHFLSSQDFERKIQDGFFLEWSGEYDHYYGTPRHIVDELEQGLSRILIIDRFGAERVLAIAKDPSPILTDKVTSIWIYTSDISELERRLVRRGKNTKEQIVRRLELAQQELQKEQACPLYIHKILNDDFKKAANELESMMVCELEK